MTKLEFLKKLDQELSQLPEAERRKHLCFYEESIDDRMEDGMSEKDAVEAVGDPAEAARQILEETPLHLLVKTRVEPKGGWSPLTIVLAIIGFPIWLPLLLTVFAVAACIYAVLWSLVLTAVAVALALLAGAVGCLLYPFFVAMTGMGSPVLFIGLGLAGLGLAALSAVGVWYAVKGTVKLTVRLAKGIKSLFIRKEK